MKYIQGNLIAAFETGEVDMILHQCNCFGIGAGIAQILNERYDLSSIYIDNKPQTKLGSVKWFSTEFGWIGNLFSQYQPGGCMISGIDSFKFRIFALEQCLEIVKDHSNFKIGIPLIASGLAADKFKKGNMTDLEYFKEFIAPIVEKYLPNATVYYL